MTRTTATPTTRIVDLPDLVLPRAERQERPTPNRWEALGRATGRLWRTVAATGAALNHPRVRLGLLVASEALIAAGGMRRPDAALALDAAEVVGSITAPRRKRPGGPRVVIE